MGTIFISDATTYILLFHHTKRGVIMFVQAIFVKGIAHSSYLLEETRIVQLSIRAAIFKFIWMPSKGDGDADYTHFRNPPPS